MKIMKILVPTDFSAPSRVAVLYAARAAKKLKAEVILLAVIGVNSSAASSMKWNKLQEELVRTAEQDAAELIEEIRGQVMGKLQITYSYITGYPVEGMIESFAVKNGVDVIVMGTKGATGLKKVVMGSNAAAVINRSSKPVIVVPGETAFTQIKKIVYASDMANIDKEIKMLAVLAGAFGAAVRVLHVIPFGSEKKMDIKETTANLIKHANYPKISFHVSRNDDIPEEVDTFVADQKADMLAMFTHRLDFYEKLFGKGVTRQLAFHSRVPLLTFNKTTLK
jgi:nucleotide-binding universal stress UspA family protein